MDNILETVIQRMRILQDEEDIKKAPVDKVVASVMKERNTRVKRNTEEEEGPIFFGQK